MPIYEYYCQSCNGVFETLRPIRESSEPAPCPQCFRDAKRMMPSTFFAFTMREGYPRAIPDRGTYYHLEQEVSSPVKGAVKPFEHPEINKPEPPVAPTKEEVELKTETQQATAKQVRKQAKETPPPKKDSTKTVLA